MEIIESIRKFVGLPGKKQPPEFPHGPVALAELRQKYNEARALANVTQMPDDEKELVDLGKQIVDQIPDSLERNVLHIYDSMKFDLEKVLGDQDAGDWTSSMKDSARELVMLAGGRRFGLKLPYSGEDMFIWLMQLAHADTDTAKDATGKISDGLATSINEGMLLGKPMKELCLKKEDMGRIHDQTVIPLMFGETAPYFKFFAEVASNVPDGMPWIREIVEEKIK